METIRSTQFTQSARGTTRVYAGEPPVHASHVAKWGTVQQSAPGSHDSSSSHIISSTSHSNINRREDCLHCCSGHFSPHHQAILRGRVGEATSSRRRSRVVSRACRGIGAGSGDKDRVSKGRPV